MKLHLHLKYRLALLLLAAAPFGIAGLLINPAGGSSVGFAANPGDDQVTRNIGGTFTLYGVGINSINIAVDGFLGTGRVRGLFIDRDITTLAAATLGNGIPAGPVISPFFDHLTFGSGTTVTDQGVANTFYAVTYQSMYGFGDTTAGHTSDFQAVLFMANATIGSFHFLAGDIGISYGALASKREGLVTVGVASDATIGTGTPASVDGLLSDLSTLPTGSQFLLYRSRIEPSSDGEGGTVVYDVSVQDTQTPEPATFTLAALGLAVAYVVRRR